MIHEIKQEISRQLTVRTASFKILSNFRVESINLIPTISGPATSGPATSKSTISRSAIFDSNVDESIISDPIFFVTFINPMFKSRDIYNMQAKLRRDRLGAYSPMQTLMHQFDRDDWFYAFQQNKTARITHLFFFKGISQNVLKTNHEILIMNCTYKINRYKMPLLIITGQTPLHITFYVAFCFMAKKKIIDYEWILQQLKDLYAKLKLPDPIVIIIDMEKNLMVVRRLIFSAINHLLCL